MKSLKNIKKPAYAAELGNGMFAALTRYDWYCRYCMRNPDTGVSTGGDFRPTGVGICSKSPTGHHVWEHN